MTWSRRMILGASGWLCGVSGLHMWLNVDWISAFNDYMPEEARKLNVAYVPVT